MGTLDIAWQKAFHEDNLLTGAESSKVLAVSAFLLSSIPTPVERKALVKEMWESGAEVMVCGGNMSRAPEHTVSRISPRTGSH